MIANRRIFVIFLALMVLCGCAENPKPTQSPTPTGSIPTPTNTPQITPTPMGDRIRDIQGGGHISPKVGQTVKNVNGVVTAVRADGFYIQDKQPDDNNATSEAILIYTASTPQVKIGDDVLVNGKVEEFIPGGSATGNLSITEIVTPEVTVLAKGQSLPNPVIIGIGGRIPPNEIIEDDRNEVFDPEMDGLDFFECLESMLVQVNNAVVVGPTNAYKEIVVLADNGQGAGVRSARGGIVLRKNDFNPERIILDDLLTILPDVSVGDRIENPIIGVLDYSFGTFRILPKQRLTVIPGNLKAEIVEAVPAGEFTISAFNLQNLDPSDGQKRFNDLAKVIVTNLGSPDILSLEEVQDNNGAIDGTVVAADQTYQMLVKEIQLLGGPKYEYFDIAPEPNQDGGETGGNIRVGFLYRTDRGVIFKKVEGGTATRAVTARQGANGIELSFNPGRIEPTDMAFLSSRKPLIAEFTVNGAKVIVIGVHMNSKGGDTPLFGRYQPPILTSETQRMQQATVISRFISDLLSLDPKARVILLGDVNDFQFSRTGEKLTNSGMVDLINTLPEGERYTYTYDGNGQVLDHIFVSPGLKEKLTYFKPVHFSSEFPVARRTGDHDPVYARFKLP